MAPSSARSCSCLAADHGAIERAQLLVHHVVARQPPVDRDHELRELLLQAVHHLIAQGRDLPVLLG
jgi:hypothetical protein